MGGVSSSPCTLILDGERLSSTVTGHQMEGALCFCLWRTKAS